MPRAGQLSREAPLNPAYLPALGGQGDWRGESCVQQGLVVSPRLRLVAVCAEERAESVCINKGSLFSVSVVY